MKTKQLGVEELGKIDKRFSCVMQPPKPEHCFHSTDFTTEVKGTVIKIPSRTLLITESGKVFVQVKKRGRKVEYASLQSLIAAVNSTVMVENFSE